MFYIFDCNDKIVGNPKGYRTIRGANQAYNRRGGKVQKAIWAAFYAAKAINPAHYHISRISLLNEE